MSAAARARASVCAAVEVNYGLLGNPLAPVHGHVIPRLADAPAPRMPVWVVPHDRRGLSPTALGDRLASVGARLAR